MTLHHNLMLTRLALTEPGIESSAVNFTNGLNVITGPSNTGKTFILRCIDYMLGGQEPPPNIPEAERYDFIELDISIGENQCITLKRDRKAGDYILIVSGQPERILGKKHDPERDDTLSAYLLKLIGVQDKSIKKNKHGEKRTISFRDFAHLAIIPEGKIISDISPLLTGVIVQKTAEASFFSYLLTGSDDSSLKTVEKPEHFKIRNAAKADIINQMLESQQEKLQTFGIECDIKSLEEQILRIEQSHQEISQNINAANNKIEALENKRRTTWIELRKTESRIEFLTALLNRFDILEKHYNSDILRLESIEEAAYRLDGVGRSNCPFCGRALNDRCEHDLTSMEPIRNSCRSESQKIYSLLNELNSTKSDVSEEIKRLELDKSQLQNNLMMIKRESEIKLQPWINQAIKSIERINNNKAKVFAAKEILLQVEELRKSLDAISKLKPEKPSREDKPISKIDELCERIGQRLESWHFPNRGNVHFDHSTMDITIDGRPRVDQGKGVRAVTHAAFMLSLLRLCLDNTLPNPGFMVIDSPLIVYKEPDPDETSFTHDVKTMFFKDIFSSFSDSQVIIIENEDVPETLPERDDMSIIRFTGNRTGRSGFVMPVSE